MAYVNLIKNYVSQPDFAFCYISNDAYSSI